MNFFKDYVKDPLYKAAVKILTNTYLFEMAYERKDAINKLAPHVSQLARKMVMVHHAVDSRDLPHWKTTLNAHLLEIHDLTFLKGKKRLSDSDLREQVFEGPIGEYSDYSRKHDWVKKTKSETKFSDKSEPDYEAIKRKYERLLVLLKKDKEPKYEDLLDS